MNNTKQCPGCGQDKPQSEFNMTMGGKVFVNKRKVCMGCSQSNILKKQRDQRIREARTYAAFFGGIPEGGFVYEF